MKSKLMVPPGLKAGVGVVLTFLAACLAPDCRSQNQVQCDAKGNEMVVVIIPARCYVKSSGLWNSFELYGPWELYGPNGSLLKTFGANTVWNTDWQTTCGPANEPTAHGVASDGSGQYVNVTAYIQWGNYVYSSDGDVAYGPFNPSYCSN